VHHSSAVAECKCRSLIRQALEGSYPSLKIPADLLLLYSSCNHHSMARDSWVHRLDWRAFVPEPNKSSLMDVYQLHPDSWIGSYYCC
jgi:hypothetical protein